MLQEHVFCVILRLRKGVEKIKNGFCSDCGFISDRSPYDNLIFFSELYKNKKAQRDKPDGSLFLINKEKGAAHQQLLLPGIEHSPS